MIGRRTKKKAILANGLVRMVCLLCAGIFLIFNKRMQCIFKAKLRGDEAVFFGVIAVKAHD